MVQLLYRAVVFAAINQQVFDHHYHFDHLLDTAYEVEGHGYQFNGQASPLDAASPLSSQGDLTELGKLFVVQILVLSVAVWGLACVFIVGKVKLFSKQGSDGCIPNDKTSQTSAGCKRNAEQCLVLHFPATLARFPCLLKVHA